MTTSTHTVRIDGDDFDVSLHARAWQPCDALDAVDGTVELIARSAIPPERTVVGLIHGHLSRAFPGGPFEVAIALDHVREVLAHVLADWAKEDPADPADGHAPGRYREEDARWVTKDCPVPHTRAPRYAGAAAAVLEAELGVGRAPGMQDWPLEVCDPARVEEFCAFYDRASDPLVRFDTMQLALFSFDERLGGGANPDLSRWFEHTLTRDFALHGHTVAYWAALEREHDDPELSAPEPEFVFSISGLLRRVWEASLVPVDLRWRLP